MKVLFSILLIFHGVLFGQESLLLKPVTIEAKNMSLEAVLEQITLQTGVHFSYNSESIDPQQKISLVIRQRTLKNALDEIKREIKADYKLIGNQVVLKKKKQSEKPVQTYTISGYFRDAGTSESLPGASIIIENTSTGTITNAYGFYSLSLTEGEYGFIYSYTGYSQQKQKVTLNANTILDLRMELNTQQLSEVLIVSKDNTELIESSQMSKISVNPKSLAGLPEFAGEVGLIKSLQTMPGIKTHSDGSAFFFVRGGNKDQNLILIDEAPVFNPAHLFGYYSVIIPEVAKSISIYKGDIPFEKSERISSLIDVQTRDGNMKSFAINGVLNPLINRFALEGPLKKDKSSFYTSYRRSNFKWLYQQAAPNSDIYLYDFNAKLNFILNNNNRIFFSFFQGKDNLTNNNEGQSGGIRWTNTTSTIRWNHVFNSKLFSNLTLFGSTYNYSLFSQNIKWESEIGSLNLKMDFAWFRNPVQTLKFGLNLGFYESNPGNLVTEQENAAIPKIAQTHSGSKSLYISNEHKLTDKLSFRAGLRMPVWTNRGQTIVYMFDTLYQVVDTLNFQDNERVKTYVNLDPGLSLKYMFDSTSSVKLSYGIYHQYLNLLSNSISPFSSFETWLPAGTNIKPQRAEQFAFGMVKLFSRMNLEFTAEAYYKSLKNQLDYEPHASLLLNPLIEGELRFGSAYSYGAEFMLRRTQGRFSGWISYTWSKTRNKIEGLNGNREFPPFYDRPHDFSIFVSWNMTRKLNFSANWVYYTGSAITTPVGFYHYNGYTVPLYGDKNNDRLPDYHRLDVALTWNLNKPERHYQHSFSFGIYNFYNRQNPVSINFNKIETKEGKFVVPANLYGTQDIVTTQKYLLGIMPSITYKFAL